MRRARRGFPSRFLCLVVGLAMVVGAAGCKTSSENTADDGGEGGVAGEMTGVEPAAAADQQEQQKQQTDEGEDEAESAGEMRTKRFPDPDIPTERLEGKVQAVTTFFGAMPTGVTAAPDGRVFVNFPRWGDDPRATVAEIIDGKPVAYPNEAINELDEENAEDHFISVQSVVVGPAGETLWVLDTGSPKFGPTIEGGAKLVGVDLESNEVTRTIVFPSDVALKSSYLNDVRFDYTRGGEGMAYITDSTGSGKNGIVVVDLKSGKSWRRLHEHPATQAEKNFLPVVEGRPLMMRPKGEVRPSHMTVGSDGIAIHADGERLFFRPLSGRGLFSVSLDALSDPEMSDDQVAETLTDHGQLGFASDGLEADAEGRIYLTNYEDNGVMRWDPETGDMETLVHHPQALWPDTLALVDGWLYFTANQLHRQAQFHRGEDLRNKPYALFRVKVDAKPVRLK